MKNATLTLSLVESELMRLHVIQKAIAEFTNNLETLEPDSGDLKPTDYCSQFGFHYRTVRRWCEKLLGPEKREIERQIRNVSCN